MRASRVITMLTALQHHGQLTARQLAAELGVTPRTILRDVETLSSAGVPIYATQGSGGGIRLLDGFVQTLSAITIDDASGLLWAGQQELAALLGLAEVAGPARRALLGALLPALAASAVAGSDWFIHDPAGRAGLPFDPGLLTMAARAVQLRVTLRITGPLTETDDAPLLPLGIVLEAGHWRLVHLTDLGPKVLALADVQGDYALGRSFAWPEGFDLHQFWRTHDQ